MRKDEREKGKRRQRMEEENYNNYRNLYMVKRGGNGIDKYYNKKDDEKWWQSFGGTIMISFVIR